MTAAGRRKLSDNEIDNRIRAALETMGDDEGETAIGDAALATARNTLSMLSLGLAFTIGKREDHPGHEPPVWPWPSKDQNT